MAKKPRRAEAERYAEMLANMVAADSAPIMRTLAEMVCQTLDTFAAESIPGADDYSFKLINTKITPAVVRRKVPAMIVKLWDWEAETWPHTLNAPDEPGGITDHSKAA